MKAELIIDFIDYNEQLWSFKNLLDDDIKKYYDKVKHFSYSPKNEYIVKHVYWVKLDPVEIHLSELVVTYYCLDV